jgi:hypothetical protein
VPAADDDVPKLPRGRGIKFSTAELFRIAITVAFLVAVIVLTKPCSSAVSTFVMGFGSGSGSGSARAGSGSAQPDPYEHLSPDMTEEQLKAAIDRAKARNAAETQDGSAKGSGSGVGSGAGSGTGAGKPPAVRATFAPPPAALPPAADGSNSLTDRRRATGSSAP